MAKRPKLKRGFYWRGPYIWTRDPVTGQRCTTRTDDPEAAYRWRAKRDRIAADPVHAAASAATVGGWCQKVMAIKTAQRSEGTAHMYGVKLGHIARLFGKDAPMVQINANTVDAYIAARREEGAGSNTISRELVCLRQVLKYAKRSGEYPHDIASVMPIGFSAEYTPVKRTLARADFDALWTALPSDKERAWVALALAFAADVGDLERMRPEDFKNGVMLVRGTKTGWRRQELPVLPLFAELVEFALPHLPVSWPRASKALGEACAKAGLPHLSPKDLRRTAATWLIEAGADQVLVSRFLRHKGDQMVRRVYGQVSPAALGSLLGTQTGTPASQKARPLGGTGRRRGLKRLSGTVVPIWKGRKSRAGVGASGRGWTRTGTADGTPAAHWQGRKSRAA
jgi:integrase